jgi:rubrerythrin
MRDALHFGLKREFEAMALYEAALGHVKDPDARATLEFLVAEERHHLGELSKGLARTKLGEEEVGRLLDDLREGGRRRAEAKMKELLAEGPPDAETILKAALAEERESEEVYKLNARTMPDIEVRALYLELMNEEKDHIKTIKAALRLVQRGIVDPRNLQAGQGRKKPKGRRRG